MKRYPFIIHRSARGVKMAKVITARTYRQALTKILALYPNKFITTTYSRTMDLITAKVQAAAMSQKEKGATIYIMFDPRDEAHSKTAGECELSKDPAKPAHYIPYAAYKNGGEVALEPEESKAAKEQPNQPKLRIRKGKQKQNEPATGLKEQPVAPVKTAKSKQQKNTTMATATKKSAKKSVSKTAKKAAKKSTAKKEAAPVKVPAGAKKISIKDLVKELGKGEAYAYNRSEKPLPIGYLSKMKDQSRELVMKVGKEEGYTVYREV